MQDTPLTVFAPGAWNRSSAYDNFRNLLSHRDIRSLAVDHLSNGADPPNQGLSEDSHRFHQVILDLADQGNRLVLVGHSYGGMVISTAAAGLGLEERSKAGKPGGVIVLVYMAAFVAERGKNLRDLIGGRLWSWMLTDGNYVRLDPNVDLIQDVPDASKAKHMFPHICLPAFLEPATQEPWHTIPSVYIVCEDDEALPSSIQYSMIKSLVNPRVFRLRSGHSPFLSMPMETADILEEVCK
ncbi:alpha/beta-hydrolase [Aspergillus sclerotiicarbonarius CBS 121057]|uniref:Alpha/beta-hydrolase n=1 Tax=Aspergillus sclerotiicarbonarius (strain CBS 121057 / IBT 28362) TaxID=1448318 RepID=A0A319E931_ASPSB|nr:alpha/beta-hydrolase [Aspergillus sclerotiicarbonarius CBS 121057]